MSAPFYVGQQVETRRGKVGTVEAFDEAARTVDVRFGGKVFTMKTTQVASARSVAKARSYRTPDYSRRG